MRKVSRIMLRSFFVLAVAGGMSSCGGGGGGGGGGDGGTPQPQQPSRANFTQENVNSTLARVADTMPGCQLAGASRAIPTLKWSEVLLRVAGSVKGELRTARRANRSAAQQTQQVLNGECGGRLVLTPTSDPTAQVVTGTIAFENYATAVGENCQGEQAVVNGSLSFSGTEDDQGQLAQLSGSTSGITITAEGESMTIAFSGTSIAVTDTGGTVTVGSLNLTDNTTNEVRGLSGFTASLNENEATNTTTIVLDGMVISPNGNMDVQNLTITEVEDPTTSASSVTAGGAIADDKGGVMTITTISPLQMTSEGELQSGQMQIVGTGNTKIVMTSAGGGEFQVQADTNGDGTLDYTPRDLDCSNFDFDLEDLLSGAIE